MNRQVAAQMARVNGVPHARGDEPRREQNKRWAERVFPTPVGMNRSSERLYSFFGSVPHARGDEPDIG